MVASTTVPYRDERASCDPAGTPTASTRRPDGLPQQAGSAPSEAVKRVSRPIRCFPTGYTMGNRS